VGVYVLAACWGLAEATLFFIVPDALLTWVALEPGRGPRRALLCAGAALAGALVGGAILWWLGGHHGDATARWIAAVPAISERALVEVNESLRAHGWRALLVAGFLGTPYKIFALEAGRLALPLGGLLLASVPARLSRFLALTAAASVSGGFLARRGVALRRQRAVLLSLWLLNYLVYWSLKDW
jgi:membrane protein YqaA with SNARE-associated domain